MSVHIEQNELTIKAYFSVPGAAPHAGHQHEVQLRPADRGALQDGPLLPRGLVGVGAGEGDGDSNDDDGVDDDDVAGDSLDAEHKVSVTPGQPQQDCDRPGNTQLSLVNTPNTLLSLARLTGPAWSRRPRGNSSGEPRLINWLLRKPRAGKQMATIRMYNCDKLLFVAGRILTI